MSSFKASTVENEEIYKILKKLESLLLPTETIRDVGVKIYEYLFIPFKEDDKLKFAPFSLSSDINFSTYRIQSEVDTSSIIKPGNKPVSENFSNFINLLYSFAEFQSKNHFKIKDEDISKHFRIGKVKLKYVIKPEISKREAKELMKKYKSNLKRKLPSDKISLREYLSVAEIIYDALNLNNSKDIIERRIAYGEFKDLSFLQLPLDDPDAFEKWKENADSQAFEIVRGRQEKGVCLFPPKNRRYRIYIPFMFKESYNIIVSLLENKIPFKGNVKEVLGLLTGEAYVGVNKPILVPRFSDLVLYYFYDEIKRKDKIIWKRIREVKYKSA
jgi:hypothetical protein